MEYTLPNANYAGFMADDCCNKVICEISAAGIPLIADTATLAGFTKNRWNLLLPAIVA